jgi:ABC-type transport system involved in Fe-S cluster assembly fused permease/ATPase subunit
MVELFVSFFVKHTVLKDGQIIEQGSHRELLELSGLLASMWAD